MIYFSPKETPFTASNTKTGKSIEILGSDRIQFSDALKEQYEDNGLVDGDFSKLLVFDDGAAASSSSTSKVLKIHQIRGSWSPHVFCEQISCQMQKDDFDFDNFQLPCSHKKKTDEGVFAVVADEVIDEARSLFCTKKKKAYCSEFRSANAKVQLEEGKAWQDVGLGSIVKVVCDFGFQFVDDQHQSASDAKSSPADENAYTISRTCVAGDQSSGLFDNGEKQCQKLDNYCPPLPVEYHDVTGAALAAGEIPENAKKEMPGTKLWDTITATSESSGGSSGGGSMKQHVCSAGYEALVTQLICSPGTTRDVGVYYPRNQQGALTPTDKIHCFPKERYCPPLTIYMSGLETANAAFRKETNKLQLHAEYSQGELNAFCSSGFEFTSLDGLKCAEKDEGEGVWVVKSETAGERDIEFSPANVICTRKASKSDVKIPNTKRDVRLPSIPLPGMPGHLPGVPLPSAPTWHYGDKELFTCELGYQSKWAAQSAHGFASGAPPKGGALSLDRAFQIVYDLGQQVERSDGQEASLAFFVKRAHDGVVLEKYDETKAAGYCVKKPHYCPKPGETQSDDLTPVIKPARTSLRQVGDTAKYECTKPNAFEVVLETEVGTTSPAEHALMVKCVAKTESEGQWEALSAEDIESELTGGSDSALSGPGELVDQSNLKCAPRSGYCPSLADLYKAKFPKIVAENRVARWRGKVLPEKWLDREHFVDSVHELQCGPGYEIATSLRQVGKAKSREVECGEQAKTWVFASNTAMEGMKIENFETAFCHAVGGFCPAITDPEKVNPDIEAPSSHVVATVPPGMVDQVVKFDKNKICERGYKLNEKKRVRGGSAGAADTGSSHIEITCTETGAWERLEQFSCRPHVCEIPPIKSKEISARFTQVSPSPDGDHAGEIEFGGSVQFECLESYQEKPDLFQRTCKCGVTKDNDDGMVEDCDYATVCAEENEKFCPATLITSGRGGALSGGQIGGSSSNILANLPEAGFGAEGVVKCETGFVFIEKRMMGMGRDKVSTEQKVKCGGNLGGQKTFAGLGGRKARSQQILHSGNWWPEPASLRCEKHTSFCPAVPKNLKNVAAVSLSDELSMGSVFTVKCEVGYQVASGAVASSAATTVTEASATCTSAANWDNPSALKDCEKIPRYCDVGAAISALQNVSPDLVTKTRSMFLPINEKLAAARADYCLPGYSFPSADGDSERVICIAGGEAEKSGKLDPPPFCTQSADFCPAVAARKGMAEGILAGVKDQAVEVGCAPGYAIIRSDDGAITASGKTATVTCSMSTTNANGGQWVPDPKTLCGLQEDFCPPLQVENGSVINGGGGRKLLEYAKVGCDSGYQLPSNSPKKHQCVVDVGSGGTNGKYKPAANNKVTCVKIPQFCPPVSKSDSSNHWDSDLPAGALDSEATITCAMAYAFPSAEAAVHDERGAGDQKLVFEKRVKCTLGGPPASSQRRRALSPSKKPKLRKAGSKRALAGEDGEGDDDEEAAGGADAPDAEEDEEQAGDVEVPAYDSSGGLSPIAAGTTTISGNPGSNAKVTAGTWAGLDNCQPIPNYCKKDSVLKDENKREIQILKSGKLADEVHGKSTEAKCLNPAFTKLVETRGQWWRGSFHMTKRLAVCVVKSRHNGVWDLYGYCSKAESFCYSDAGADGANAAAVVPAPSISFPSLQFEQSTTVTICAKGFVEESILDWEVKLTCTMPNKAAAPAAKKPTSASEVDGDESSASERGRYKVQGVNSERLLKVDGGFVQDGSSLRCVPMPAYCPEKDLPVTPQVSTLPHQKKLPRELNSRVKIADLCQLGYRAFNEEKDELVCSPDTNARGRWKVVTAGGSNGNNLMKSNGVYQCDPIPDWCAFTQDAEKNFVQKGPIGSSANIQCLAGFQPDWKMKTFLSCGEDRKWEYTRPGDFDGGLYGDEAAVITDAVAGHGLQSKGQGTSPAKRYFDPANSTPELLLCEKKPSYCKKRVEATFTIEPGTVNELVPVVCAAGYEPNRAKVVDHDASSTSKVGASDETTTTAKCVPSLKNPNSYGEYAGDLDNACVPKQSYCPDLKMTTLVAGGGATSTIPSSGQASAASSTIETSLAQATIGQERKVSCAMGYGCPECNFKRKFTLTCTSPGVWRLGTTKITFGGASFCPALMLYHHHSRCWLSRTFLPLPMAHFPGDPIPNNGASNPCRPINSYCPRDPHLAPNGGSVGRVIDVASLKAALGPDFCRKDEDVGFRIGSQEVRAELKGVVSPVPSSGVVVPTVAGPSSSSTSTSAALMKFPYQLHCQTKTDTNGEWKVAVAGFDFQLIPLPDFIKGGINPFAWALVWGWRFLPPGADADDFDPASLNAKKKKFAKNASEKISCPAGYVLKEKLPEDLIPKEVSISKVKLPGAETKEKNNALKLTCTAHIKSPNEEWLQNGLDPDWYCEPTSCEAGKVENGEIREKAIFGERVMPVCDLGFASKPCMCGKEGKFLYVASSGSNDKNNPKFVAGGEEEISVKKGGFNLFGGGGFWGGGGDNIATAAEKAESDAAPCACKLSRSFCNEQSVPNLPLQGRRRLD
eukprot:g9512.t1